MNEGMLLAAKRIHIDKIPKRSRDDVFKYFQIYLEKTIKAITEWQYITQKSVAFAYKLPATSVQTINGDWFCDAVITSPPYINAIDYIWASKFELHWLGMVENDRDRLDLYTQEIGTERIPREEEY